MQIEAFMRNIELPKKYYDSNFDISEKFSEEAKIFLDGLKKIDGSEFSKIEQQNKIKEKITLLMPEVQRNINRILEVFRYYEGADLKSAQEEFDELMTSLADAMFVASIDDMCKVETSKGRFRTQFRITGGRKFYRVRGVKEKRTDIENNPDELFHIPLTKKALTNNERFSLAGFPSLYLASMLPLAWQECGYPQRYYYSEYQYLKMYGLDRKIDDELKFLALYSPSEIVNWGITTKHNDFDLWIQVIYRCLMMYPLVLACSFVNHSGKGSYKQEYVIPQMLMQWVQRNNNKVQGISYFTCVDISMMQGEYCAYNVVIPALKPYDEKKYSQRLRDEFVWTDPTYFEIPLFDAKYNKDDKKQIYDFISKIRKLSKLGLPEPIRCYLDDIERVCICVYNFMLSGNNSDIQMTIHILNMINTCCRQLKLQSIDQIIEDSQGKNIFLSKDDFENSCLQVKEISQDFLSTNGKSNNIGVIIDKYRNTLWNDFHHESWIDIGYRDGENIHEIEEWCQSHHLLYFSHILSEEDAKSIGKLIDEIVTPLVQRRNSSSIYDTIDYKAVDYVREGFDPIIHESEIIGI